MIGWLTVVGTVLIIGWLTIFGTGLIIGWLTVVGTLRLALSFCFWIDGRFCLIAFSVFVFLLRAAILISSIKFPPTDAITFLSSTFSSGFDKLEIGLLFNSCFFKSVLIGTLGTPGTPGTPGIFGTPGTLGTPGTRGIFGILGTPGILWIPGGRGTLGIEGTLGILGIPGGRVTFEIEGEMFWLLEKFVLLKLLEHPKSLSSCSELKTQSFLKK